MSGSPEFVTADNAWLDGWLGPSAFRLDAGAGLLTPARPGVPRDGRIVAHIPGTVFPGFTDSHVHLGLIDPEPLMAGGIARVVDLGWEPGRVAAWAAARYSTGSVAIDFAGAFLTSAGGYPSDRSWAPAAAIRQIASPAESAAAIDEMVSLGASRIKIALNSAAGPVWNDDLLETVIAQAHSRGVIVVAHAEGPGQANRAARFGADLLAHTPWDERLAEDELRFMSRRCAWITTLDVHGWGEYGSSFDIALDNLARFAALGGRVVYGTDLGNGPLPVGLNERELRAMLAAGLSLHDVIGALVPPDVARSFGSRISWVPGQAVPDQAEPGQADPGQAEPGQADPARWLAAAIAMSVSTIKKTFG